jgi:hypothetical protein
METIQFLTKEQINGLINILERDYILPKIKDKINLLKETDKYKENYNKIKELTIKTVELFDQLVKFSSNYYKSVTIDDNDIASKTLDSLKVRTDYNIKSRIVDDLKSRLQLISPSDFDSIIKSMSEYIDVNKHLYKEEIVDTVEAEEDYYNEDYD